MEYADQLWVYNRSGKLEVRTESIVVGNVQYTRTDIAQSLADALGRLYNACLDDASPANYPHPKGCPLDVAEAALANYRKGE